MTAPVGWILRLQHAVTVDHAQDICRDALADGADPRTVAAALVQWNLEQEASTVTWTAS